MQISKGFVLAAGEGVRMRPLTNHCPKPLLEVGGVTMLDRALDALTAAGVTDAVVNSYYLPQMIEDHVQKRASPRITLSRETALLDTGGGVKKALPSFGNEPFYVLNGDVVWTDGAESALKRMARLWNPEVMDLLLLLYPVEKLPSRENAGDYYLAEGSHVPVFAKGGNDVVANMIFAGPRIVHPRLFDGVEKDSFSFLELFHKAEAAGRLAALVHDGAWYHVGTPEALAETNEIFARHQDKKALRC